VWCALEDEQHLAEDLQADEAEDDHHPNE